MSTPKIKKLFLQNKTSYKIQTKKSNNLSMNKKLYIKGPWTNKENEILIDWINKNGPRHWTKCSHFIKGRTAKQCREHWNNSLNTEIIKGNWSPEEDLLIMIFYKKCEGSWKKMIPIFKLRTENSIKNRFFSQLRKITSKFLKKGKNEYSTKYGLDTLLKYYEMGVAEAKKNFFENNSMDSKQLEEYITKIENLVKHKPKGQKYIDLDSLRGNKGVESNNSININKIIDINESEDEFNKELNKSSYSNAKKKKEKKIIFSNKRELINHDVIERNVDIRENINEEEEQKQKINKMVIKENEIEKISENIVNNLENIIFLNKKVISDINYNIYNNINNNLNNYIYYNNNFNNVYNINLINTKNNNLNVLNGINSNFNNYSLNNIMSNVIINNKYNNNYSNYFDKNNNNLFENIKENEYKEIINNSDNNQKQSAFSNQNILKLLNTYNLSHLIDNKNHYNYMNSGLIDINNCLNYRNIHFPTLTNNNLNFNEKKYNIPQFTQNNPNFNQKLFYLNNSNCSDVINMNKEIFPKTIQSQYQFNKL